MLTQGANLANLVTTIHNGRTSGKGEPTLTETFQTFVAEGGAHWKQESSSGSINLQKQTSANSYHKDAYEKEKLSVDSYSVNKEKVKNSTLQNTEQSSEADLTEEQISELQNDIRDVLKEALDMDDTELDDILSVMNMNILSLLEPANLQEFLLTATGSESIDLLTNSTLIDVFQQMSNGIEGLVQEYGLNEAELNQILTQEPFVSETEDVLQQPEQYTSEGEADLFMNADQTQTEVSDTRETKQESVSGELPNTDAEDGFSVTEEKTGIQVSVRNTQENEGHGTGQQMEHSQQGIAADIVNQLAEAVNELEDAPASFTSDVQQSEIIRQVIEQIKVISGSDMNRIEVQLYPQHLGRIQIQVMMKNGVMTAQINAETEMAKEAIESQLQQLKESFHEKSIQVEAVEVNVGTSNFQNEQERQDTAKNKQGTRSGNRRIRLDEFGMPMEELTEEEQENSERLEAQGASVEFTA